VNIRRLIKNAKIRTSPDVNKAVLNDLIDTLDKSKNERSADMDVWKIIKFAAAAVIIIVICFFFTHHSRNGRIETPKVVRTSESKSPAQLTSLVSLNMAFRRGGMEAVEKQFAEADKKVRQSLKERITIEQLLCELGECEEI